MGFVMHVGPSNEIFHSIVASLLFCYSCFFLCTPFFVDSSRRAMDFCSFFFFRCWFGLAFVIARSTCRAHIQIQAKWCLRQQNLHLFALHSRRNECDAFSMAACFVSAVCRVECVCIFGMETKLETRQADAIYTKHNDSSFCFDRFLSFLSSILSKSAGREIALSVHSCIGCWLAAVIFAQQKYMISTTTFQFVSTITLNILYSHKRTHRISVWSLIWTKPKIDRKNKWFNER